MKQWNFGIVGAGLIADFHCRAIADLPNGKVVAICDVVKDRAQHLANKYGGKAFDDYEFMIADSDVDIVTIATPSGLHMEPTVYAAEQGKHVLCEKPLDVTLERIDAMIAAHDKAGTRLGGIFPYRYNEALLPLKEAIAEERFGTISYAGVYVPWWRTDEYYQDSWHGTLKLDGGGALMNQSIHMIDMLCDVMPPVKSVQAFMDRIGHPQIEAEDTAVAVLRFVNGALGIIYGTTSSWPGQLRRFEISGTRGTVIQLEDSFSVWQFAEEKPQDNDIREKFGKVVGPGGVADPAAITHHNHTRNFAAFLNAVENDQDFAIDGKEARKAVEVILSVYEAAGKESIVHLDP